MLNRGKRHGLAAGAVLAVDQRGEVVHDVWGKRPFGKDVLGREGGAAVSSAPAR